MNRFEAEYQGFATMAIEFYRTPIPGRFFNDYDHRFVAERRRFEAMVRTSIPAFVPKGLQRLAAVRQPPRSPVGLPNWKRRFAG